MKKGLTDNVCKRKYSGILSEMLPKAVEIY